ncbi:tigger transposable element-derived protein 4-like [Dermacentor silvarum]|uniref:tigger transposable element-derived protein 4-like n=1 Tax=Dermacentor silvarum TaxID=543639 RepID=UPI00189AE6E7|nr:tigger transposable element-derived protein 4-like [Dermacentor silvarum]XP_049519502.1 tigger transposable element-derived protein 4-like [Dermacentor silvarum]XP_049519503.1 tigger transposable element-derived protein 4-like [Dermacentor silvarum]
MAGCGTSRKRYNLAFKRMRGESGAVDQTLASSYRADKLCALLRQYSPDNFFNCDEMGLFYKMLPDKTLALSGEPCHGGKHSKECLTVVVGGNMSATEKLPLLFIGKSKHPRCFKGVRMLLVWYEANSKAWITQDLFEKYIRKLDRKYELQNRKVLMFVYNCGAHGHITSLKAIDLEFLPPNTSVLQPMDQGVIKNLKVHYRSHLLNRVLLWVDRGKKYVVDVFSAISILSDAWKAVTVDTIRNCFRHAAFVLDEDSATGHDPAAELPPDTNVTDDLRASGVDIPAVTFEQFANFDSAVLPCA